MCVCAHMYDCMYICMYVRVYVCMNVCVYAGSCVDTNVRMRVHMCVGALEFLEFLDANHPSLSSIGGAAGFGPRTARLRHTRRSHRSQPFLFAEPAI